MAANAFQTARPVLCLDFATSVVAASTPTADITTARGFDIYEVTCLPTGTAGGASTARIAKDTLGNGSFVNVTDAMACQTSGTIARATSIAAVARVVTATDVLRLTLTDVGGGTTTAHVYVRVLPNAITGAS